MKQESLKLLIIKFNMGESDSHLRYIQHLQLNRFGLGVNEVWMARWENEMRLKKLTNTNEDEKKKKMLIASKR